MPDKITIPKEVHEYRDNLIREGLHLAESSARSGGYAHLFDEKGGMGIDDEITRAYTAILVRNADVWMRSLDESTMAMTVGGYRDYMLPIVRASFPSNPINNLVSVQPLTRANGTVYWINYVIDQTRGAFKRGQTLFDANNGWAGRVGYTDEKVAGESFAATVANATQTGTIQETPIRAGSVEWSIADGSDTYVLRDTGNGTFVIASSGAGVKTLSASSVNYVTGAVSATFSAALAATGAMSVNYVSDTEGQYIRAQVGLEIQSAPISTFRRAIGMRVSMESVQNYQAEMGADLTSEVVTVATQQILTDQAADILLDMWLAAPATPDATFDATVPTGVNRAEHFRDINYELQIASGNIADTTQRGEASWYVVDQKALNVMSTAGTSGGFVRNPAYNGKGQGLVYVGEFNGIPVYKYKYLNTFPGAAAGGNILVGYKGPSWWDAGLVLCPFQQFYTNGPDDRADLTRRQAFAMRYGRRVINRNMWRKIAISNQ